MSYFRPSECTLSTKIHSRSKLLLTILRCRGNWSTGDRAGSYSYVIL